MDAASVAATTVMSGLALNVATTSFAAASTSAVLLAMVASSVAACREREGGGVVFERTQKRQLLLLLRPRVAVSPPSCDTACPLSAACAACGNIPPTQQNTFYAIQDCTPCNGVSRCRGRNGGRGADKLVAVPPHTGHSLQARPASQRAVSQADTYMSQRQAHTERKDKAGEHGMRH